MEHNLILALTGENGVVNESEEVFSCHFDWKSRESGRYKRALNMTLTKQFYLKDAYRQMPLHHFDNFVADILWDTMNLLVDE